MSTITLSGRLATLALACACSAFPPIAQAAPQPDAVTAARDDLYRAANGKWLDATVIPADKAEVYGADLPATINARLRTILEGLRTQPRAQGSTGRKLVDFYDSQRDLAAIDRAGMAAVLPALAAIDAIATLDGLARWQGQAQGLLKRPCGYGADSQTSRIRA